MTFDRQTLDLLEAEKDIDVVIARPDGTTRRTTIWVVVVNERVYVRSWKGERGYWYQAARENPENVSIVVDKRSIPVRAVHVDDEGSIEECSLGLTTKYRADPSTRSMVHERVLGTTLLLEPR